MSNTSRPTIFLFLVVCALITLLSIELTHGSDDIQDVIGHVRRATASDWEQILSWARLEFDLDSGEIRIRPSELLQHVELLGALRHADAIKPLAENLFQVSTHSVPPRGCERYPCVLALMRHDSAAFEPILEQCKNGYDSSIVEDFFGKFLSKESFLAVIDNYIEENVTDLDADQKRRLLEIKERGLRYGVVTDRSLRSLPPLSDFVLNHPLYKARLSAIKANLAALEENKEIVSAVQKLGELRAIEAVKLLVPMLLLKPETLSNNEIDKRYDSIEDYPVAVALAQIGIPSIWGLLDEIVANDHDDQYFEVAYKTMTVILPDVAIPGFVNEVMKKQRNEIARQRLYKLYPLMGIPLPEQRMSQ